MAATRRKGKSWLRRARDLVAAGWTQGAKVRIDADGGHAYCMMGALEVTAGRGVAVMQSTEYGRLRAAAGVEEGGLSTWNDRPETTQAMVLEAYATAIAAEEVAAA